MRLPRMLAAVCLAAVGAPLALNAGERTLDGWKPESPRDEIRPRFELAISEDVDSKTFNILSDFRPGLMGALTKAFPVEGGSHYRFSVDRRTINITVPRRAATVRLI